MQRTITAAIELRDRKAYLYSARVRADGSVAPQSAAPPGTRATTLRYLGYSCWHLAWAGAVRYRILGPIEVESSRGLVRLEGGRQRALLALLLAHRNEVLSAPEIADVLWGEEPPETWRTALQVHVSNLRKALGPEGRLLTRPGGYVLETDEGDLDADRFLSAVDAARGHVVHRQPAVAARVFGEALAMWHGEVGGGLLPFDAPWYSVLAESRDAAFEERAAALVDTGLLPEAIAQLRSAISRQPYRERLRELLMLALYRAGRQEEALAAYRDARLTFRDELGLDPGIPLQRLEKIEVGCRPGERPRPDQVVQGLTGHGATRAKLPHVRRLLRSDGVIMRGHFDAIASLARQKEASENVIPRATGPALALRRCPAEIAPGRILERLIADLIPIQTQNYSTTHMTARRRSGLEAIELAKNLARWGECIEEADHVIVISGFADDASIFVEELERDPSDDRWE